MGKTHNSSMIRDALQVRSASRMADPNRIQYGIKPMQNGVDNTLTAMATVVSDTENGSLNFLLITRNAKRRSEVLNPGMGNIPNQKPKNKSIDLSAQLICLSGSTRCV